MPHSPFDASARFRKLYHDREIPDHLLPYYAEITRFDETVGQLLDFLTRREILDDTLIVFACDNGFRPNNLSQDKQNKRSKLSAYEDGLRTPILIRWDGRVKAVDYHQLVHTVDLVPTMLSAAGLSEKVTSRMHGVSLLPSVRGNQPLQSRAVFGAIYPNDAQVLGAPSQHVRGRWVREGDFKLLVPGPAQNPLTFSLFNLKEDPKEQRDLAQIGTYATQVKHMRRLLDHWWDADTDTRVTKH